MEGRAAERQDRVGAQGNDGAVGRVGRTAGRQARGADVETGRFGCEGGAAGCEDALGR